MDKLIKAQRKSYYFLINTAAKRVAVIFVAFLTLFTASMSVKAIREPVINFVVEVYESFTRYFFDGDTTNNIDKVYSITNLPSGFTKVNKFENETNITVVYQNSNGNIIEFSQGISDNTTINIDTENSAYKQLYVNEIKVDVYEWDDSVCAIWNNGSYTFNLMCDNNAVTIDDIKNIIKSVD